VEQFAFVVAYEERVEDDSNPIDADRWFCVSPFFPSFGRFLLSSSRFESFDSNWDERSCLAMGVLVDT
jgi:hypothetical protein